MTKTSGITPWALAVVVAMLVGGCFSVKAPETIDFDLGSGTGYVGDRRPDPAPADAGPDALRQENLRLRNQLADTQAQLKKARRQVDDLEDKLEDMGEELKDLRDAIKRAHGGGDD
jgi:peptidoglycan hydrolase CwlO-like protein